MMVSADSLLTNLNSVFDSETKANLKTSISELSSTITTFKNTSNSLNNLISDNQEIIGNTFTNVDSISTRLSDITDSIANAELGKTIEHLDSTLVNFNEILASMKQGEGSMGKLLKDEELYNNLSGATREMEELLRDIKLHPKRYFRILSKKEIPYKRE
jgi:phospholipid/cholesterol/gamma-HCH transport system substrate-binding protein